MTSEVGCDIRFFLQSPVVPTSAENERFDVRIRLENLGCFEEASSGWLEATGPGLTTSLAVASCCSSVHAEADDDEISFVPMIQQCVNYVAAIRKWSISSMFQ